MTPLTLADLAACTGGRVVDGDPGTLVTGPAFLDTRTPEPGGLFVAFVGEHADGHDHARTAVEAGASAVLSTRPTGVPGVVVDDAQRALQDLARWHLDRVRRSGGLRVVAITGSQGKTSAKDMLARVLADAGPTVATYGSFNNELGLPLTVLRATDETRFLVLEMGARGVGHLAALCEIAAPDVSLVLNVGKAHLGEFGSQAAIARAKGEIVEALDPVTGTAVLNSDDPLVRAMAERTTAPVVTFGTSGEATVRLDGVRLDDLGRPSFELVHEGAFVPVALQLVGAHQATNAVAAAAVAVAVGLRVQQVAASLQEIRALSRWRMELAERADGLVVVNDAYNANPDSMRAALETLAAMGERSGRRTVAVLGEMRELGADAPAEHRAVGALAHRLGIDVVVVVGSGAAPIHEALLEARGDDGSTRRTETLDEAGTWVRENVAGPDLVLVKASRAGRLERLAELLLAGEQGDHVGEEPGR